MIRFDSRKVNARFHNPLEGGKLVNAELEYRRDPLLGHISILSDGLAGKREILFPKTDEEYITRCIKETMSNCFLCDDRWKKTTPRYPDDLISGGRLIKGDCVLFPNLFPVASYHAVIMVGKEHYRRLSAFSPDLVNDALQLAFSFIKRVFEMDQTRKYWTINANYLAPAGASLVHPHFQLLGDEIPSTHHERLLSATKKFYDSNGENFWKALVSTEKDLGLRYVLEKQGCHVLTAFSPMGTNEVLVVWPEIRSFLDFGNAEILIMAEAISMTLGFYEHLGFSTFNFACFSPSLGSNENWGSCIMRIVCRQNMVPDHRTDDYYLQKLLQNEIAIYSPENLASIFKAFVGIDS
ncbi:MAG TPA: hypothetical protein ENG14_04155 [Thermodesulforhabdus norvegica]|uniref:Galactose-1-phosphate uridylyltransferase n=1 Tax=Thermodesulforhabdus norvegica TaxID=39841 RepID=A0A7C1AW92_9BACT|nr:hypothetical protein [Thermodesulforhabdus norvegica]